MLRLLLLSLLAFGALSGEPPLKPSCWDSFKPEKKRTPEKKPPVCCYSEPSCYSEYDPCCETCKSSPRYRCCPPLVMAAGAAVFGGAIAAVILNESCGEATTHSLQFVVRQLLDTGGTEEVRIILPNSTVFQAYFLTDIGPHPSNVISNPANGTYAVNLILSEIQNPSNFSVDVIVNGSSVILGGSFTGNFPLLTFTYTLAL